MALSKMSSTTALCRALFRCCESGRVLRPCIGSAFHQTDCRTIRHSQVQKISTSFCHYERHFAGRSSAFSKRNGENTSKNSTDIPVVQKGKYSKTSDKSSTKPNTEGQADEKNLGVIQRFKNAYKEHGKVLIGVHLATSVVWYGTFWYTVHVGVDVVSFFERLGVSERILNPMRNSGAGDFAVAYLMYKLATPARYTVTLGGTNFMIRYLRKIGKMSPQKEKMRDLVRDSRKELKPKISKSQLEKLKQRLRAVQARSKSRVQKLKGRSQRRMVQLRKFIRSAKKKK